MAVKIRLARFGKKKQAFYRIVVAQNTSPRDGRFIETLGTYDPRSNPGKIILDAEKTASWLKRGARPTPSADNLLRKQGVFRG